MTNLTQLSRRSLLGAAALSALIPSWLGAATRMRSFPALLAGNYDDAGGKGLVPVVSGIEGWAALDPATEIRNASYGLTRSGPNLTYLLDEGVEGGLGIFDGSMARLARYSTLGAHPCHIAMSPDGAMLAVANYTSGDVAYWQLDKQTGMPVGEARLSRHVGSGPNSDRQQGPHAHWVGFTENGEYLHAVDLGADAIFVHALTDDGTRLGTPSLAFQAPAGSGPRHLARHPGLPVAYLVTELANTLIFLDAGDDGTFRQKGQMSTLPADCNGPSSVAHVAINAAGTRLYVSNRGHDSISVFALHDDGLPELIQNVSSGGHWPRFFLLLEDRGEMLVANQRSGNIAVLGIEEDGKLVAATANIPVPGVAFIGG